MKVDSIKHTFLVSSLEGSETAKNRLDHCVLSYLIGLAPEQFSSRSQIQRLIKLGGIRVNGSVVKKTGVQVCSGDKIDVDLSVILDNESQLPDYEIPLNLVYEDEYLLVIDKPADLSMHPGAGNTSKTLLNALYFHYPELRKQERAGIVHRLDKDTTGLVVVAKSSHAHHQLASQFEQRTVQRRYRALCFSTPRGKRLIDQQDQGRIETLISRDNSNKVKMRVSQSEGKRAVTNWTVLQRFSHGVLVELKLETGRTHQIRVHLTHIGSSIIGDTIYQAPNALPGPLALAAQSFGRQALHAFEIGFFHPNTKKELLFYSEIPPDMQILIDRFKSFKS